MIIKVEFTLQNRRLCGKKVFKGYGMNYLNYHFIVDLKCEGTMAKIRKLKDRYIMIIILVYDPDNPFHYTTGSNITVTIIRIILHCAMVLLNYVKLTKFFRMLSMNEMIFSSYLCRRHNRKVWRGPAPEEVRQNKHKTPNIMKMQC